MPLLVAISLLFATGPLIHLALAIGIVVLCILLIQQVKNDLFRNGLFIVLAIGGLIWFVGWLGVAV